jgi:orotidine-5'-phosphate decarboxylase
MDFKRKLAAAWSKNNSLLCVGLDPDLEKLPKHLLDDPAPYFAFNKAIIDATADLVCAFKPNSAFYEARGAAGIEELNLTCSYLRENYPDIPIILDFKRGDIGNTNNHYAKFAFEYLGADAITIHPYQGREAVQSLLDRKDKGIIVWCRSSNDGAGEFQDLIADGKPLYAVVAEHVVNEWNANNNALLVAGATFPGELSVIRKIAGEDPLLMPGIGAQRGDIGAAIRAGLNSRGNGLIINASRAVIYADDGQEFAQVARGKATELRDEFNAHR